MTSWEIYELSNLPKDILYQFDNTINNTKETNLTINYEKICKFNYKMKFENVIKNLEAGNTYLLNLTQPTKIHNNFSLLDIYKNSNSKFKLYYKNKFVCFSPEKFIDIYNNNIYAYPMKGTINANIKDAKNIILNDKKELSEHTMIVDLLRNDLSTISSNVSVDLFRYSENIKAGKQELIQVSSQISGSLNKNWNESIGDIIVSLLPAGSITGAPKINTIKLIKQIEQYDRGFFTGICGIFDGKILRSNVLIRFIEKINDSLLYKSGGGITLDSIESAEYQELCDKIYIP